MKIAHITPAAILDEVLDETNTYHLALVSQVRSNVRYRAFYRRRSAIGHHVILDNDAYENGSSSPLSDLLDAFLLIVPKEVVCMDEIGASASHTLDMVDETITYFKARIPVLPDFMAVAHGLTPRSLAACAVKLDRDDRIACIGLPRSINTDFIAYGMTREKIFQEGMFHTPVHFLGLNDDEHVLNNFKDIRGLDTSKFVRFGIDGFSCSAGEELPSLAGSDRTADYFDMDPPHPSKIMKAIMNTVEWNAYAENV